MLAAELDEVLGRRTQTESLLTGGGRDALLALRGAVAASRCAGTNPPNGSSASCSATWTPRGRAPSGPTPAELGRAADDADRDARAAARDHEDLAARVGDGA